MKTKSYIIFMLCLSIGTTAVAQKKALLNLEILPDNGSAVVTYKNGESYLLSLPNLEVIKILTRAIPEDKAYQASISPDGKRMVVFHDKSQKIVVWDVAAGSILFEVAVDVGMNYFDLTYTFSDQKSTYLQDRIMQTGC